MARDDDQKQVWVSFSEILVNLRNKEFLALESASGNNRRASSSNAQCFKNRPKIPLRPRGGGGIVEFDAACDLELGGFHS